MLAALTSAGVDCNASLKLTQLGLDLGDELARENLRRILDQAAESDTFIRIDMESSEYVDRTLDIFTGCSRRTKTWGGTPGMPLSECPGPGTPDRG
jgi:proline dehydrogenase